MLEVNNITFSYNNKEILNKIDFISKSGEITTILGENGSGKTTLLKIIDKLLKPQNGCVLIENQNIKNLKSLEMAKKIGYCPQNSYSPQTTVFETILTGRMPFTRWFISKNDLELINDTIKLMGLSDILFNNINHISGGELQKVIIARAIVSKPKILLLDEPINHLDIKNQHEIMQLLYKITKDLQITSIIVLHDINIALRYADNFIVLKDGAIIASGAKEIITENIIEKAFNLKVKIIYDGELPLVLPLS
jgi:iron complex transport system ATP-binding protein